MKTKSFSKQLRMWRVENNLTQKQAGELFGVCGVTISCWETEKTSPANRLKLIVCQKIGYDFKIDNNSFGSIIRRKRLELGLSRKELADEIGYSEYSVNRWENNLAKPFNSTLKDICDFFGLNTKDFKQWR